MKLKFVATSVCALFLTILASGGAFAIDKMQQPAAPTRPTKMSPTGLTAAECKGLGGKVAASVNKCDSGSMCLTTDSDCVVRSACVTKQ
jgi:hypothetical protein